MEKDFKIAPDYDFIDTKIDIIIFHLSNAFFTTKSLLTYIF